MARKKESVTEIHQSALMDHVASKNHTIDWEGVRLPEKEPDCKKRGVKEAIFIRKAGTRTINWDGAATVFQKSSRSYYAARIDSRGAFVALTKGLVSPEIY